MPCLTRTDLHAPQKVDLAASALLGQGQYGAISELAELFDVSRPTVYQAAAEAEDALKQRFAPDTDDGDHTQVVVDAAQLERALVAMRAIGPLSIRQIEDLVPILYPGLTVSYGKIQGVLAEAERNAAIFNQQADLSAIRAGALDEMFSQGAPVLAGIDLDSAYLFALALREGRSGDDWAEVLEVGRQQDLELEVVVKDAALGIAAGVRAVFPDAEQRDDCFHAVYQMGQQRSCLERRAYGAMALIEEAEAKLEKCRRRGRGTKQRRKLARKLVWAKRKCEDAMTLHDEFERACRRAREAMEIVDLERGVLRDAAWLQAELEHAADQMLMLEDNKCCKAGRYLRNRAPGLSLYATELTEKLFQLSAQHGEQDVLLACIVWRLMDDLRNHRRRWRRQRSLRHLAGAYGMLVERAGPQAEVILAAVDALMQKRHRASSAIEGFNSFLRPYLYVHKGVTQGFLELLRAYYNLRTRRWGRHKGTSATECLTGEPVEDWLDELGYQSSYDLN